MLRRRALSGFAAAAAAFALPLPSHGALPPRVGRGDMPPMDSARAFADWMVRRRAEDRRLLEQRFARFEALVRNRDLGNERNKRAFLLTPREHFVLSRNVRRAYEHAFLDIDFGVTISGPHLVGRMTSAIDVQMGDRVLEVGTGSGYQSAYLSQLTDQVWTIEIIKPLAQRTRGIYGALIAEGYEELKAIRTRHADGYHGWTEAGPFDKILVTCGIDHIPPPLLKQLKVGGVMVIPVGPPGAQHVLRVTKEQAPGGEVRVVRSDIYNGRVVPFLPFTKLDGDVIRGTHRP